MRIYLHSERAEQSPAYIVTVAPAGDTAFVSSTEALAAWRQPSGLPKQIEVAFKYGQADVDDALGKYMVARGIAHSNRLVRRISQFFDASGRPVQAFDETGRPIVLEHASRKRMWPIDLVAGLFKQKEAVGRGF